MYAQSPVRIGICIPHTICFHVHAKLYPWSFVELKDRKKRVEASMNAGLYILADA